MYSKIFIVLIFGCGEKGTEAIKNPREKKNIYIYIDRRRVPF